MKILVKKVMIIGLGNVGTAVATAMVLRGTCDELYFVDKNDGKAQAEKLDLSHQSALLATTTKITALPFASHWEETLAKCDVLVFSPGKIALLTGKNPDRLGELPNSLQIVEELAPRIKASNFKGIVVSITNPCDAVVTYLQQLTALPKERIFGTGTTLETIRMKYTVADKFDCNVHDVSGYVLGEHGETQFTAWSTVAINHLPIIELAKKENLELSEIQETVRRGAWDIIANKKYTSQGIGLTATAITEAIFSNSKKAFPLSSYNETYQTYIGQVTKIGELGVLNVIPQVLTPAEEESFAASATAVYHNLQNALKA